MLPELRDWELGRAAKREDKQVIEKLGRIRLLNRNQTAADFNSHI
jgi:hypothetical protein